MQHGNRHYPGKPQVGARFRIKSFTHYFHHYSEADMEWLRTYRGGVFTVRDVIVDALLEPVTFSVISDELSLIHHVDDIEFVS